ncbi:Bug family tripartite tricarboxylate transporter substrate binding protein [Aquabacterium sp. J223]|uniref:Bug family tripartite tricarboxylate transporter substrate binding protein n=1 Tax=Aquabacterium sp. J223 TaxID=2898431 RepID=UPI0021ADB210|nr:tripartite tricarboxylate transporter substrate binding protein [Aquabacterium sp. J223]UUX94812.1 tripartite tricarboxylate transporter substrate binding protein [Aquabacterium sp. J223]
MRRRYLFPILLAMAGAQAQTPPVQVGAWPDKPIRIIVPLPPGGPSDIVLRAALEKMQPQFRQPLVLENKPGAAGNLGASEAARAAPDGHTWLWSTDTLLTVNPHVYKQLGFKPDDLVPVMIASSFSQTLVCNAGLGVKALPEWLKKVKAEKLSYASGGAGSPGHLSTELLLSTTGSDMAHIPYKGPAPAVQDVIGGQVPCGFLAGPTVLPHVRSGRLVALAVSGARRSPALPEVPTVAEAGVAGYDATFSLVLFAPRGVPDPVVAAFTRSLAQALSQPDVVDKLKATDQEVVASNPAVAAKTVADTSRKWGEVARRIKLQLD